MKILRHPLFMRPHPDVELEHLIDRELRRLPDRAAPDTLVPRVLQALAAKRALPWWKKSYVHWPIAARLAFVGISTGLAGAVAYLLWGFSTEPALGVLDAGMRDWVSFWAPVRSLLETLTSATLKLVRAGGPWLIWGTVSMAGVSYLTTVGLGTVCWRLVARRA